MAELLTVNEVAQDLGVSSNRVYQLVHAGILPHVRLGHSIRFPRQAWADWLRAQNFAAAVMAAPATPPIDGVQEELPFAMGEDE